MLRFRPLTGDDARSIASWRYAGPHAVLTAPEAGEGLDEHTRAVVDEDGALVARVVTDEAARAPDVAYTEDALDVGLALRPDLVGGAHGLRCLLALLAHVLARPAVRRLRATIEDWNAPARRLAERVGFRTTAVCGGFRRQGGVRRHVMVLDVEPPPVLVVQTPRLMLRELAWADLDFVAAMLADERVMRFYPKTYDREEAAVWIDRQRDRYRRHGHGLWLAVERATGARVGQVGLVRQTVDGAAETEVGYLLAAEHWGKGYATEAAAACRDHAFDARGVSRVVALIRPENAPSQRVAARLGLAAGPHVTHGGLDHVVWSVRHC